VKHKFLIGSFISFLTVSAFAAEQVRISDVFTDFTINGTTNTTVTLNFDKPTEMPIEEAKAVKIYVPMQTVVLSERSDQFYLHNLSGTTQIFDIGTKTKVINFPLRVWSGPSDHYLYALVYDPDSSDTNKWIVAKSYAGNPISSLENAAITFPLSPADICARVACTGLGLTEASKTTKIYKVYFFVTTSTIVLGGSPGDITQSPYNNGIYFSVGLSNKFISPADFTGTVTNVRRGDKRLFLEYNTPGILDPLNIRILDHNGSSPGANLPIGGGGYTSSTLRTDEMAYMEDGEVLVRNLTNGVTYNLSFVMTNKYLFATPVSNFIPGTPAEIEELLKKNSCFLLTAGFGEDHYIINYFRHFRDSVLLKNYFGKKFVGVYYEMAPKYALMIYENESIRAVIRGIAYILYFSFTHIYLMLLGAILIPTFFICSYTLRKIKTAKL
jgi:hypothetical protein